MASKGQKPTASTHGLSATPKRAGRFDAKTGAWLGRPDELGADAVVLDPARPRDKTAVARVLCGARQLYQAGKISDRELVASDLWHRDWSMGTGHPLRASEMRHLGVSLGGAAGAAGIVDSALDAATRHRAAATAVGQAAAGRLYHYVCEGRSMSAMSSLCGLSRNELAGALIGDLQRLGEHYHQVDSQRRARRPEAALAG